MANIQPIPPPNLRTEDDALRSAFVEMLFALAVSQVAIYAADLVGINATLMEKLPAYAHLGVGLVLVAASWLGWRQSYSPGMKDKVQFVCSLPFLGLLLDVLLVVLYFIVVRTVEINQTAAGTALSTPTAIPESFWVSVVFAAYAMWDFIADVLSKDCIPKARLRSRSFKVVRVAIVSMFTSIVCLALGYVAYRFANATTNSTEVIFVDAMLIFVVVFFRVLKASENALSEWFSVMDCKAFQQRRETQGIELWSGMVLMLLYAGCAWGASGFNVGRLLRNVGL